MFAFTMFLRFAVGVAAVVLTVGPSAFVLSQLGGVGSF